MFNRQQKVLLCVFLFVLVSCAINAREVQIWPGMNMLGKATIAKNSIYYNTFLSFVIEKEGKNKFAYPLSTELTKKYIKTRLMVATLTTESFQINQSLSDIKITEDYREVFENALSPTDALVKLIVKISDNPKTEEKLKVATLKDAIDTILEAIKEAVKGSNGHITQAVAQTLLKKINTKFLDTGILENYPTIKMLLRKSIEISINNIVYYAIDGNLKYLKENIAENVLGGFLNFLEIVNNIANLYNTVNAWYKTNKSNKKIIVADLMRIFMRDYIFKYNMKISSMAGESIYKNYYPYTFNTLFMLYLLTHNENGQCKKKENSYLGKANIKGTIENLLLLNVAAKIVLNLIEKYGNGGNNAIYLEVNNKIEILKKSYQVSSYYWMPSIDYIKLIFNNFPGWPENPLYYFIEKMIYTNPFKKHLIVYYSKKHINISINNAIENNNLFILNKIKKVIDYQGIAKDNGKGYLPVTCFEKKIFKMDKFYVVNLDKFLDKINNNDNKYKYYLFKLYYNLGIINPQNIINNNNIYFTSFISIEKLKNMMIKNTKIIKKYKVNDVEIAFKNLSNSIYFATRGTVFKIFASILKNKLILKNNMFYSDIDLLKKFGITNGEKPDRKITIIEFLIMLNRFNNIL